MGAGGVTFDLAEEEEQAAKVGQNPHIAPANAYPCEVNPSSGRLRRLLLGVAAAGIITTTLLAPTSAQAEPVPDLNCSAELDELRAAQDGLVAARAEYRAAVTARDAAKGEYDAAPTRRHYRALRVARTVVHEARAARIAARVARDVAKASYVPCLPRVAVTNVRVAHYGNYFAVADTTWTNVPNGEYHYFLRYDDAATYQGAVTFVDVIPPRLPSSDPWDPFPPQTVNYRQNGVTYEGGYLGPGCDYTPGENISVELWTGTADDNPTGLKVASATVDNPCH